MAGMKNLTELKSHITDLNHEIKNLKQLLSRKHETDKTVIDELKAFQQETGSDENTWMNHVRELRKTRMGENAWILNEVLREYDLELKRRKKHGIADDVLELGPEILRIPELLFSPAALINYEQCGITEALEIVMKKLEDYNLSQV